jgi:DNA-directed RNA polymerase subunit RPC12/RpoP
MKCWCGSENVQQQENETYKCLDCGKEVHVAALDGLIE